MASLAAVIFGGLAQAAVTVGDPTTDSELHKGYPFYFSKKDCQNDAKFTFIVTATSPSSLSSVQVWMSEDKNDQCWNSNNREQSLQGRCYQLPFSKNESQFTISARSIIAGLSEADSTTCTDKSNVNGHKRRVYLYFIDIANEDTSSTGAGAGGATSSGSSSSSSSSSSGSSTGDNNLYTTWDKGWIDLEGPTEPSDFSVGIGDKSLVVSYTGTTNEDILAYTFYCAPYEGDAKSCALPDVFDGGMPTELGTCGGDLQSTSGEITLGTLDGAKLSNGTQYAVAMAPLDEADNIGTLTAVKCQIPQLTDGFFDKYKQGGGNASGGCGLCSARADSVYDGLPALLGGAVALAVFAGRRRSRRGASPSQREAE